MNIETSLEVVALCGVAVLLVSITIGFIKSRRKTKVLVTLTSHQVMFIGDDDWCSKVFNILYDGMKNDTLIKVSTCNDETIIQCNKIMTLRMIK